MVPSLSTSAQAAPGPAGPTVPGDPCGPCRPCGPVTPSSVAAIWVSFDLQAVSRSWILFLRLQMTTAASAAGASSAPATNTDPAVKPAHRSISRLIGLLLYLGHPATAAGKRCSFLYDTSRDFPRAHVPHVPLTLDEQPPQTAGSRLHGQAAAKETWRAWRAERRAGA